MEDEEKIKKNAVLEELLIGIAAAGMIFQVTVIWLVKNKLSYTIGLWIGVLLAAFLARHMWKTLNGALDLEAAGAEKAMRKQSIIRYGIVTAVLGVLMCSEMGSPLAAFLGVMTLKVAAYLQPFTHKVISKLRR